MKLYKTIHTRDSDSFFRKTLQQYEDDYFEILDLYKSKNEDNDETTFIDYEIGLIKDYIKPVTENIKTELETKGILDLEVELNIKPYISSYKKIISFLETKKSELKPSLSDIMNKDITLNWQGTPLQFAELTKSLIQSGLINANLTEKEIFERMRFFFNVPEFNKSDKLKDIRSRTKDLVPLINKLETSLTNWIKNKD